MRASLLVLSFVLCQALLAQDRRYVETIFPSSTITNDVVYGQALFLNAVYNNETNTTIRDLVMDIYEPTGDAHDQRAAIIFAHSGGFFNGNRSHDDMVALCDSFARKGYVTATIDYRKGFYFLFNAALHGTRAVYRGIQDGRTAVRYFRANAASLGIDPDHVYLAGSSAGGFIALHSIYMTETDEIPPETGAVAYTDFLTPRITPDLGPPDAGSNPGFSGTPNGVVNFWGAISAVDLVDATDDQPVFLAHGTDDGTVPFITGPPFGFGAFPDVFGSGPINDQLDANGTAPHETYFVPDADHEFYGTNNGSWANGSGPNLYWDTLLPKVTNFLWQQHKPTADFSISTNELEATFTDTSIDAENWFWDFGDGATSTDPSPTHTFAADGDYAVKLFVSDEILSWDTLEQIVTVEKLLPLRWTSPLTAVHNGKETLLEWSVADQVDSDYFRVEHAGAADQTFRPIGQLAASGNLTGEASFAYVDENPVAGTHYYRIRQFDYDGQNSLSTVATVQVAAGFSIFPNPANDNLSLSGLPEQGAEVELRDLNGRVVTRQWLGNQERVSVANLPAGIYLLRVPALDKVARVTIR